MSLERGGGSLSPRLHHDSPSQLYTEVDSRAVRAGDGIPAAHKMQFVQETEYLTRITRFGMINCFLVREDDGFSLIDTSVSGTAAAIVAAARKFGAPIRRIFLTHAHIDHVGSLDALVGRHTGIDLLIGSREARLLTGDFSLEPGECQKKPFGFPAVSSRPTRLLADGERVRSLQAVSCPGHTPGHMAFLDTRDGTLIAGDAFTNQVRLLAAGTFKLYFPLAALFAWDRVASAESARKLRNLNPTRLAVGHGKNIVSPLKDMDRAVEMAFQQSGKMLD
jgi:glyoxylase-like metal-dependent hydrolase (beta-lactamase superfamily II)